MFSKLFVAAIFAALTACGSGKGVAEYRNKPTASPVMAPGSTETPLEASIAPQTTPNHQNTTEAPQIENLSDPDMGAFIIASITGFLVFVAFAWFMSFVVLARVQQGAK
jgi:hypothetical protein